MTRSQGTLTEAVRGLQGAVDRLTIKMDKFDDLRVAVGKLESSTQTLTSEMESTKTKLDSVRKWVIGAAAVIMFIGAITPIIIHFVPSASQVSVPTAPSGSKTFRR